MQEYIKFGYMTDLLKDSDPIHDILFTLLRSSHSSSERQRYYRCKYCKTPLQQFWYIADAAGSVRADVRDASNDDRDMFVLLLWP